MNLGHTFVLAEVIGILVVVGLVIAAAVLGWERYHRPHSPTAQPTAEVFIDPATGIRMRVWIEPATGAREYRPD